MSGEEDLKNPEINTLPTDRFVESDLDIVENYQLVMRHTNTFRGHQEIEGDTLAMGTLKYLLPEGQIRNLFCGFGWKVAKDAMTMEEKNLFIKEYNKAIDEFLVESVGLDIHTNKPTLFLLISSDKYVLGDEIDHYHSLGKIRRGKFSLNDVKAVCGVETLTSDVAQESDLNSIRETTTINAKTLILDQLRKIGKGSVPVN